MTARILQALGLLSAGLILVSCVTAGKPATTGAGTAQRAIVKEDIVGHWEGDWGTMYLKNMGGKVRGVYTYDDGRVIGTFADGVFTGWWSEAPSRTPPSDAGAVEFTFIRREGSLALDGRLIEQSIP